MNKKLSLILALTMILSLFSACAPADLPIQDPTGSLDPKAQYLNTYIDGEPDILDPSIVYSAEGTEILHSTTESLTRMSVVDGAQKILPAGAASWSVSDTGTVWTFVLNPNKWLDGTAVTAHDYVYALQRTAAVETGAPNAYMLYDIVNFADVNTAKRPAEEIGVRAVDDMTLEITLAKPAPQFLSLTYLPILAPQHKGKITTEAELYGTESGKVELNGPFTIESWEHGKEIVLKKNINYREADTIKLDTVTYKILPDANERLNLFEKGELDVIKTSQKEWVKRLSAKDDVLAKSYALPTVSFEFFNTTDVLFQNANVRRAFMLGIDREKLNADAFDGGRIPAYGWVSPAICVGDQSFRGAAGEPVKALATDYPDAKSALLTGMSELGLGDDPTTLDITFYLAGTDEWYKNLGLKLTEMYKESLGIDLKIKYEPWDTFIDDVETGAYQLGFMAWNAAFNDPIDILNIFRKQQDAVHTNWASDEYDKLIDQAQAELDTQVRIGILAEAEKMLIDNAIVAPLAYSTEHLFVKSYVVGYPDQAMSSVGISACSIADRK